MRRREAFSEALGSRPCPRPNAGPSPHHLRSLRALFSQPPMSRLSELPSSFYITGGTLPPDSPSYISRAADDELFQRCLAGDFCYVLTSRQMGKSSLMAHTAEQLRKDAGTTVAIVDLSQIGTEKD